MSIRLIIQSLSQDIRDRILSELCVEYMVNDRPQYVHAYAAETNPDDDVDYVYVPFRWAIDSGFFPSMPADSYPTIHPDIRFSGELRPHQQDVKRLVLDHIREFGCALLSLHVGWGKTVLAVNLIPKLKRKTLVVVNRVVLLNQWKRVIETMLDGVRIQIVKPNLVELDPDADVYLVNAVNVPKFDYSFFRCIGTLIADEVHLLCAKTLSRLFFYVTPLYLIGLSATPYRPDGLEKLLHLYLGHPCIVEKLFREHQVYALHTSFTVPSRRTEDGRLDWNAVLEAQCGNEKRNSLIVDILCTFQSRSFLVLCKRLDQGHDLVELLLDRGESVTHLLGSKGKHEFDSDARIVVATNQKCGVGFSHDKLDALLLASDAENYFIQYLGRVFRTPDVIPLVIDLVDKHNVLKKHFKTRQSVYEDAGGTVEIVRNVPAWLSRQTKK